jgi:hypothetical protein
VSVVRTADDQLRALWGDGFTVEDVRPRVASTGSTFGEDGLWALLATWVPG